jgi:hypothetical protein
MYNYVGNDPVYEVDPLGEQMSPEDLAKWHYQDIFGVNVEVALTSQRVLIDPRIPEIGPADHNSVPSVREQQMPIDGPGAF